MSNASDFIIENGVLKAYIGAKEGTVQVPDGVTEIAESAFYGCWGISGLILPDSVIQLPALMCNQFGLESVVLPKHLKVIPAYAFSSCRGLEDVTLPDDLEEIEYGAFSNCRSLSSIILPQGLKKLGADAFNKAGLAEIKIPSGISVIPKRAFFNLHNWDLTALHIPGTVKTVGEEAFAYCSCLESLTVEPGVEKLEAGCFRSCNIKVLHLPDTVKEIGENAFHSCTWLKEFSAPGVPMSGLPGAEVKALAMADFFAYPERYTDPEVITGYHKYLFSQKKKWLPVIFKEDNVKFLSIYGDAKKITAANFEEEFLNPAIAANAKECLAYLLDWKNRNLSGKPAKRMTSTLDKDPYAVGEMKKLWLFETLEDGSLELTCYKGSDTEVSVPPRIGKKAVSRIGAMAFSPVRDRRTPAQCDAMRAITKIFIPNTVTRIHESMIRACTGLKELTVEDGNPVYHTAGNCLIETESKTLICGCLTSVIPTDGSVTAIGCSAFEGLWPLTSLEIPDTVNRIGAHAFGYTKLVSLSIPHGVTIIPEYCFDHCEDLTEILIPDSVTEIEHSAIYACMKLKDIYVPASVTKIGDFVFSKAVIHAPAGSYAEEYARINNKRFIAE